MGCYVRDKAYKKYMQPGIFINSNIAAALAKNRRNRYTSVTHCNENACVVVQLRPRTLYPAV